MATTRKSTAPSSDRRVRRTRLALARALIELAEERELSRIGVSDVAERAEVSRSAFYDHYGDVHELAEDACTAMIDELIESLPGPALDSADLVREAIESLTAFFGSLAGHAGLYHALLGAQGSARVAGHIRRRVAAVIHERLRQADAGAWPERVPHDVTAAFTAGALMGVATDWLERGCPRPPAEMAAITWPLLNAHYRVSEGGAAPARDVPPGAVPSEEGEH
ncbi:TetR family regulatory protein of MDR cluster [[Actinomadura] parvosata subsp. kistnae]|uniref:TetR family transcriptional regulator n=1 Tax=[Actinomadura] parvosata subsp. kistnae TaxID=1909395 RepID=A0A1U9ZV41_9ACTN|nr:TetR/AcrR family transcriptional regulator [Nonomuraea sp. ATCC 55076]AQZ61789.1 TetR family transcriptional regulator [Nonomuraea sp. ATCC 55076]SPL87915.1 TetR family regulatory protein of MDR cluster [Actinomadura parvosata subsp. kistnae]